MLSGRSGSSTAVLFGLRRQSRTTLVQFSASGPSIDQRAANGGAAAAPEAPAAWAEAARAVRRSAAALPVSQSREWGPPGRGLGTAEQPAEDTVLDASSLQGEWATR